MGWMGGEVVAAQTWILHGLPGVGQGRARHQDLILSVLPSVTFSELVSTPVKGPRKASTSWVTKT